MSNTNTAELDYGSEAESVESTDFLNMAVVEVPAEDEDGAFGYVGEEPDEVSCILFVCLFAITMFWRLMFCDLLRYQLTV